MIDKWKLMWLFLLLDFCCHNLGHLQVTLLQWKTMKERKLEAPALSELKGWYHNHVKQGDAIPANNKARQIESLATSNIVHTCTIIQCTLYIARAKCTANSNCKCQPEVRKGLRKTPLSFKQNSSPRRIHLERRWSPPTLVDFPPTSLVYCPEWGIQPLCWGFASMCECEYVLCVSCSLTVRYITALAPSFLVPNLSPCEGCHL